MNADRNVLPLPGRECKCAGDGTFADWSACPVHDADTSPAAKAINEAWRESVLQGRIAWLESALRAIRGPADGPPFIEAYRAAGGGYEGLQAIAEFALNPTEPTSGGDE